MTLRFDNQRLHAAIAAAIFVWTGVAMQSVAWADDRTAVVLHQDTSTCPTEIGTQFIDELRLRTSAEMIDDGSETEKTARWQLSFTEQNDSCQIRLEDEEHVSALVITPDADRLEIASGATRLAWIIDGIRPPEAEPLTERNEPLSAALDIAAMPVTGSARGDGPASISLGNHESLRGDTPLTGDTPLDGDEANQANLFVDAVAGPMWIPAAKSALMTTRAQVGWQPRPRWKLALGGRLPLNTAQSDHNGIQYSYRPFSLELTTGYTRKFSQNWSLSINSGARRTIAQFTAVESSTDTTQQAQETDSANDTSTPNTAPERDDFGRNDTQDQQQSPTRPNPPRQVTSVSNSTWANTLSRWSAVANIETSYSLLPMLALRLSATAAMSFTDRRVRHDERIIMDLGRFDLDVLMGLEWRF